MAVEDPRKLLFLDETSTPTTLTPLRARSPRGTRAPGQVPHRRRSNVTLLATLTPLGMGQSVVIDGAANRTVFGAFIVQRLVPTLRRGQIVAMDNLNVHKSATARAAIAAAGCQLRYLPAYSPDFNPIELAFAKIKQALRRAQPRSYQEVLAATKPAITAVTTADSHGFDAHAGFHLPEPNGQPL
jgi:transposase